MIKAASAFAFFALFACRSISNSPSLHEEGRTRSDAAGFPWHVADEEELISKVLLPGLGTVTKRPGSDPLRQRLQFWLDQLDRALRDKDPLALKQVPRPQILLLDHATPQAFVASMEACLNKTGQMQGADGTSEDFLGIDRELGGIYSVAGPRACVTLPYQGAELQRFMDWYLKAIPGCRARVTKRTTDFSATCLKASVNGPNTPAQTRNVFVRLSSHWLVVTTGLIKGLSEGEAVYTVFHEAGHYYKAHLANRSGLYNVSRELAAAHPSRQARLDPRLKELGEELLYWLKAREFGRRAISEGAPGQRYHSGLYVIARNMIQDWIRKEGAQTACKDLSQHFLQAHGLVRFPLEKPDARGQQSYLLYEQKVDACLAGLPLDAVLQKRMMDFTQLLAPWSGKLLSEVPSFRHVKELWNWLNEALPGVINAPDRLVAELSRRADAEGLGHYTSEQEADELALEWLTKFGIDPHHGVTAALKQLKLEKEFSPKTQPIGAYTYEQCVRAYEAKFRAADGREQPVPLVDYKDPHNSRCFLAFHMYREIRAHSHLAKPGVARVTPPAPAWEAIAR
jgi:hypothetical protein